MAYRLTNMRACACVCVDMWLAGNSATCRASALLQLPDDTVTALANADFDQDLQPDDLGFAKDDVIVVSAVTFT